MKYWLFAILLSMSVYGVNFSVDVPQNIGYGVDIPVEIMMENSDSVYGYEFVITSDLNYRSHQYLLNNTINSLVHLNQSAIRVATIAPAGIANGSRAVVRFNYSSNVTGNFSFSVDATAYSQNGTSMPVNLTDDKVVVEYDRIEIETIATNDRTADVKICMKNSRLINHTALTLDWNANKMRLISASVPYNGSEFMLDNITTHSLCEDVATLTFNITAQPGDTVPISVVNLVTTSPYPIVTQNGQVHYGGFYVECTGTHSYRNSTAQVQVRMFNYTAIDSWRYNVLSNISLVNGTSTVHNGSNATLVFEVTNQTDGIYPVILKNLTAINRNNTFFQSEAVCMINITTDCRDADNDTYYSGTECNQTVLDCDDSIAGIYPNATEKCNKRDDDCDGVVDEDKVCKTSSSGGGGGGGGGGGSSSSSGSSSGSASAGSAGAVGFGNMMFGDEETFKQPERTAEEHKPIQTKLAPAENEADAIQKRPEPKKVNLVGHLLGVLVLLAAGIFLAYEHIKHKHKH